MKSYDIATQRKLQKNKTEKNKAEEKGISAEMKKHTQSYARKTQNQQQQHKTT